MLHQSSIFCLPGQDLQRSGFNFFRSLKAEDSNADGRAHAVFTSGWPFYQPLQGDGAESEEEDPRDAARKKQAEQKLKSPKPEIAMVLRTS